MRYNKSNSFTRILSMVLLLALFALPLSAMSTATPNRDWERLELFGVDEGNIARLATVGDSTFTSSVDGTALITNGALAGAKSSSAWNPWGAGAGIGSQTSPVYVTLTWDQTYTIDAMRVMWWIYTDSGINWPTNAYVQAFQDGTWQRVAQVGINGNSGGGENRPWPAPSPWSENTAWNVLVFDTPVTTNMLRLEIYGAKTGGTAPGVGISEWEVFAVSATEPFVPVANIVGVPAGGTVGTPLVMVNTVLPEDATNRDIDWRITDDGGTDAYFDETELQAISAGTVNVTASICDGLASGEAFEKSYVIQFYDRGDANCDGKITAADAAAILRQIVKLETLTEQGMQNAGAVEGGAEPTAATAAKILRWIVRLENTL